MYETTSWTSIVSSCRVWSAQINERITWCRDKCYVTNKHRRHMYCLFRVIVLFDRRGAIWSGRRHSQSWGQVFDLYSAGGPVEVVWATRCVGSACFYTHCCMTQLQSTNHGSPTHRQASVLPDTALSFSLTMQKSQNISSIIYNLSRRIHLKLIKLSLPLRFSQLRVCKIEYLCYSIVKLYVERFVLNYLQASLQPGWTSNPLYFIHFGQCELAALQCANTLTVKELVSNTRSSVTGLKSNRTV